MAGTTQGGKKAAANKARHGKDFSDKAGERGSASRKAQSAQGQSSKGRR